MRGGGDPDGSAADRSGPGGAGPDASGAGSGLVERYLCLSVDVQGYGGQDDLRQIEIQHELVALLDRAGSRGGVDRGRWIRQAKGDEELALVPADVPWQRVVGEFCRQLAAALERRNAAGDRPVRLRVGMDDGPVELAVNGFAGRAVVGACRLVNSRPVRQALVAGADLAVIVSSGVYRDWVRSGRSGVPAAEFRRVSVAEKEFVEDAWLWTPGTDVHALDLGETDPRPEAPGAAPGAAVPRLGTVLPWTGRHFTGRATELARVVAALTPPRPAGAPLVCAVSGPAGVGKSTLAVHAARSLSDRYPDGVAFVDLHGHTPQLSPEPPADVLERLLRRLGVPGDLVPEHLDDRVTLFQSRLRGLRILLVLDDARDLAQVRPLLPAEPGCGALVTSRLRLTALDEADLVTLEPLPAADAAELFRSVAGTGSTEPAVVDRIVALCRHLPLAVRIVAARHRGDPGPGLSELAARLIGEQDRLSELTNGERSVAASLATSCSVLPPDQRRLFAALGCHPGPEFELTAAAAATGTSVPDARRAVTALVDRYLVVRTAPDRYRLHDLTADFARAYAEGRAEVPQPGRPADSRQPAPPGADVAEVTARLVDYHLLAADLADRALTPHRYRIELTVRHRPPGLPRIDGADDALRWFTTWERTLVEVCRAAAAHGLDAGCWQLAYCLRGYFFLTKRWAPWEESHQLALDAARRAGDRRGEAMTLNNLGIAAVEQQRLETAESRYRAALRLFEELADEHGTVSTVVNLAWIEYYRGRPRRFIELLARPLLFYERHGSVRNAAIARRAIALARIEIGETDAAVTELVAAMAEFERLGLDLDVAMTLNALGEAHARSGRPDGADAAAGYHERALEASERCGSVYEGARARYRLGQLALAGSTDSGRAVALLREAYRAYRSLGAPQAAEVAALLGEEPD